MRYLSVCSGIEAATVAWHSLGWTPVAFAEIEAFPSAVLAYRFPDVPNLGDLTRITSADVGAIDLLVGGTPCQSFSIAGLRGGLADDRGNLALEFLRLADRTRPRWLVWENVPGVLSSNGGRDFGAILGGMVELGYGFAYSVLDAQHFGVPQRRRRVFVVGYLGDWRPAAAVLFERYCLQRHSPPRREKREGIAPTLAARTRGGGGLGTDFDCDGGLIAYGGNNTAGPIDIATAVNAHGGPHGRLDFESETFIAHALRGEGFDASEDGTGRGTPLVPMAYRTSGNCGAWETGDKVDTLTTGTDPNSHVLAFSSKDHGADAGDIAPTLRAMGHSGSHANAGGQLAVAFAENSRAEIRLEGGDGSVTGSLKTGGGKPGQSYPVAQVGMQVRRLTPRECERLQGFPDDWTLVPYRGKPTADGPRYKALGNSFAVPVVRWIGERIQAVEEALAQ